MSDDAFTILVVEDDDATRTFLADNLTADGYELLVTASVDEGRRLLERQFPDLVLVDVGLPDGSGLELVRSVREADGATSRLDPTTPILVLSGRADELDRVRGFERGTDDYVVKPFSYPELRGRVAALLRRAQGRRVRRAPAGRRARARPAVAAGDAPRRGAGALAEGVLAAAGAGLRADPGVDEGRAAADGVGAPHRGDDADARLAHLPAAPETRVRRRAVGLNIWGVGYRLIDPRPEVDVESPAS